MHCKKMKFSIKDFFCKQFPADLVKFTEEILNGKLHFFCSDNILVFKVPQSNFYLSTYFFSTPNLSFDVNCDNIGTKNEKHRLAS